MLLKELNNPLSDLRSSLYAARISGELRRAEPVAQWKGFSPGMTGCAIASENIEMTRADAITEHSHELMIVRAAAGASAGALTGWRDCDPGRPRARSDGRLGRAQPQAGEKDGKS